jgi:hypothetical protein
MSVVGERASWAWMVSVGLVMSACGGGDATPGAIPDASVLDSGIAVPESAAPDATIGNDAQDSAPTSMDAAPLDVAPTDAGMEAAPADAGVDAVLAEAGMDAPAMAVPTLIAHGGVADGPLSGRLFVYVIDGNRDDMPVAGAQVLVDSHGLAKATDSTGLATFSDAALVGPQQVTVVAPGYVIQSVVGVDGANLTVDLAGLPDPSPRSLPGSATIRGTMTWGPAPPAAGTEYVAFIQPTIASILDSSLLALGAPPETQTCTWPASAPAAPTCTYSLKSRTGNLMMYAKVFTCADTSSAGGCTPIDSGPPYLPSNVAVPEPANRHMLVANGDVIDNIALAPVSSLITRTPTIAFAPRLPSSKGTPSGYALMDAGVDGLLDLGLTTFHLGFSADGNLSASLPLPIFKLPGDTTDAAFDFLAFDMISDINYVGTMNVAIPSSAAIAQLAAWQPPATNLLASGKLFSFTSSAGAQFYAGHLASGGTKWNILFLNGTTFTMPQLANDPLPVGNAFFILEALRYAQPAMLDPRNIRYQDLRSDWGMGNQSVEFMH